MTCKSSALERCATVPITTSLCKLGNHSCQNRAAGDATASACILARLWATGFLTERSGAQGVQAGLHTLAGCSGDRLHADQERRSLQGGRASWPASLTRCQFATHILRCWTGAKPLLALRWQSQAPHLQSGLSWLQKISGTGARQAPCRAILGAAMRMLKTGLQLGMRLTDLHFVRKHSLEPVKVVCRPQACHASLQATASAAAVAGNLLPGMSRTLSRHRMSCNGCFVGRLDASRAIHRSL